ncbi:C-type mannose receptor 2 isoform X1 [Petromyzon marinus]|uniref:C-type mannose receptor 2-like isoform X1 n=1 Tax=Petromyzon marinus TaxID=7757 RepID=A0AAJ7TEF5_PETMA|nr:C-type mannose receptor 2-like isoform X1 [Petromyzon marinus]
MDAARALLLVLLLTPLACCSTAPGEEYSDIFAIQVPDVGGCLVGESSGLGLVESCNSSEPAQQWKWVSRQRLFNLGMSRCLGVAPVQPSGSIASKSPSLNASETDAEDDQKTEQPALYECDVEEMQLRWACGDDEQLIIPHRGKLSLRGAIGAQAPFELHPKNGTRLLIYGTQDNLCLRPYREIYTIQGNSHGRPCAIPYKYDHRWYHSCTGDGRDDWHLWCATSADYGTDELWGFCPVKLPDCSVFWDTDPVTRNCYQFNVHAVLSWHEARTSCLQQGSDLLSITEMHEQTYIAGFLSGFGAIMWIGLNDLDSDGGWQWSDGSPLKLLNWDQGHPSETDGQNCALLRAEFFSKWQTKECAAALPYVCKKRLNITSIQIPNESWENRPTVCPRGWVPFNGSCFWRDAEKRTWQDALARCRLGGGDLLSLHGLADVDFLVQHVLSDGEEVWLGLNDLKTKMVFEWSDFTPVTFTFWHPRHPNSRPGEGCVSLWGKEGRWKDGPCDAKKASVCRAPGSLSEAQPDSQEGGTPTECPKGWDLHNGFCYLIGEELTDFQNAWTRCSQQQATLVSVTSRFEQAFVSSLVGPRVGDSFWTSLRNTGGLDSFRWLGGEHVTFTNWNRNEPAHRGECVVMVTGVAAGLWEVHDCVSFRAKRVCKRASKISGTEQGGSLAPDPTPSLTGQCPLRWDSIATLPYCYRLLHFADAGNMKSWEEADGYCRELGATLLSLRDPAEGRAVSTLIRGLLGESGEQNERWLWIGLNSRNPGLIKSWKWSDGTALSFSDFEEGHAEDDEAVRDCAALGSRGKQWRKLRCDTRLEWICKIPRGSKGDKDEIPLSGDTQWLHHQGDEYLFVQQPLSWIHARLSCTLMGGELASVRDRAEFLYLLHTMQKLSKASLQQWWIGLSMLDGDSELQWSDGSLLTFMAWAESRPNAARKFQTCVYMSANKGTWGDMRCGMKLPAVCKRWNVTMPVPITPLHPATSGWGNCPDGWHVFGDKCLGFVDGPGQARTWMGAKEYCESQDATLATIANHLEQAFIILKLAPGQDSYWVGLHVRASVGAFTWLEEHNVTFTNWMHPAWVNTDKADQGSNDKIDFVSCVLVWNGPPLHFTGKWDSRNCVLEEHNFICQKYKDPALPSPSPIPDPLAVDTLRMDNVTYTMVLYSLSWPEAAWLCERRDTVLASIMDPRHQAFLTLVLDRVASPLWIGLSSFDSGGLGYEWIYDDHVPYTHWMRGEPQTIEGCVYIDRDSWWKVTGCKTLLKGAICMSRQEAVPVKSTIQGQCPHSINSSSWLPFRGNCYAFYPERTTYQDGAAQACASIHPQAKPLSIQDEQENTFVWENLQPYQQHISSIWLSLSYDTDVGDLRWADGSELLYTNWAHGDPQGLMDADLCAWMVTSTGKWELVTCTTPGLGLICKMPRVKDSDHSTHMKIKTYGFLVDVLGLVLMLLGVVGAFLLICWIYRSRRRRHNEARRLRVDCASDSYETRGPQGCSTFQNALYTRGGGGSRALEGSGSDRNLLVSEIEVNEAMD